MDDRFLAAMGQLRDFFGSQGNDPMRAISGRFGPMTESTRAGVPTPELRQGPPSTGERAMNALMDYGPIPAQIATGMVMQPVTAGKALGEAINEPTLPNVTNAAVQSGLALFQPGKAAAALAAGYGAAGAQDAGMFDMSATAQNKGRAPRIEIVSGMSPGELDAISKQTGTPIEVLATMPRGRINSLVLETAKGASSAAKAAEAEKKRRDGLEYEQQVRNADATLAAERAKRPKRFDETAIGGLYNKTGIVTPMLLAAGVGGASRMATGGGSAAKDYYIPAATGALTGVASAHWPLGHGVLMEPAANPEKTEYGAYARDLPSTHPRKQEWTNYAAGLEKDNPTRTAITKEFYDPIKFAERSAIGLIEGVSGGLFGGDVAPALKNSLIGAAGMPGLMRERYAINAGLAANAERDVAQTLAQRRNFELQAAQLRQEAERVSNLRTGAATAADGVPAGAGPVPLAPQQIAGPPAPHQLPPPAQPGNPLYPPAPIQQQGGTATGVGQQGILSPYPPNINRLLSETTQGDKWAKLHSQDARDSLLNAIDAGKNLSPKQGKMGDPMSITPADIGGAPASTTRKQLDLLRDVLVHRGIDPSRITREQLARELATIDPRIFTVPALTIGAGGVGANALMQDPNQ